MDLITTKIIALVLLGGLSLFFGLLPVKLQKYLKSHGQTAAKRKKREKIMSALLCFGAGVLLATVFIHMIPETQENFSRSRKIADKSANNDEHFHSNKEHTLELIHKSDHVETNATNSHNHDGHDHEDHNHDHDGHNHEDHNHEDHNHEDHNHDGHNHESHHHDDHNHEDHNHDAHNHEGHNHDDHNHEDHNHDGHNHDDHHHGNESDHSNHDNHNHDESHDHSHDDHHTDHDDHGEHYEHLSLLPESSKSSKEIHNHEDSHNHDHGDGHDHGDEHSYPIAELVVCAGFFLIYFIEEMVHKILFKKDPKQLNPSLSKFAAAIEEESHPQHHHAHHHTHSHAPNHDHDIHSHETSHNHRHNHDHRFSHNQGRNHDDNENHSQHCHNSSYQHHHHHQYDNLNSDATYDIQHISTCNRDPVYKLSGQTVITGPSVIIPKNEWSMMGIDNPVFTTELGPSWNTTLSNSLSKSQGSFVSSTDSGRAGSSPSISVGGPLRNDNRGNSAPPSLSSFSDGAHAGHGHGHSHLGIEKLNSKSFVGNLRSLFIMLALSFHSIFEGLAVGLQERSEDVWYLFGAIAAHKLVIAFSIGLELLVSGISLNVMAIYMVVFALVSPVGIAAGIIVTENADDNSEQHILLLSYLQGIAAGTILYVTFFEVLERERSQGNNRILKMVFLILGFSFMAILEGFGAHSHGPN